jgi:hypothetical protein
MLLLVVRPEDRELERARLLLPEDILGVDAERDRDIPEEDERVGDERVLVTGAEGWLAGLLPEVKTGCEDGPAITIPLEVGADLSGCMRLLPILLESPLLITMPRLPEYPDGIVDTWRR